MASVLQVEELRGSTTGANANKIIIPSGQTLDISDWSPPAGTVLQVVQSHESDWVAVSVNHNSGGATVMSASITPSSATSKILLLGTFHVGGQDGSVMLRALRGSTPIAIGNTASNRTRTWWTYDMDSSDTFGVENVSLHYLDSPNTTNQVTYNINLSQWRAYTVYLNRSLQDRDATDGYDGRAASSLVLMEIAG